MIWIVVLVAIMMAVYGEQPYSCSTYDWPSSSGDTVVLSMCGYGTIAEIKSGAILAIGHKKVRVGSPLERLK